MLWTQTRLSAEMLVNPPDVLCSGAHHSDYSSDQNYCDLPRCGIERFPELYATHSIGPSKGSPACGKTAAKIATGFKYSNNELDYHRWSINLP